MFLVHREAFKHAGGVIGRTCDLLLQTKEQVTSYKCLILYTVAGINITNKNIKYFTI